MTVSESAAPPQARPKTPWIIPVVALPTLLVLHSLLRLILFWKFGPAGTSASALLRAFGIGFVADLFVAFVATFPVVLVLTLLPHRWLRWSITQLAIKIVFLGATGLTLFFLVAEYFFFEEYRSRFNTVAVDYLLYPHEIFTNIWQTYPVGWVLGGCAVGCLLLIVALRGFFFARWQKNLPWPVRYAVLGCWIALLAFTWPHVGNQLTRFSTDRLLNELAGNGWYAFVQAAVTREFEYTPFYKTAALDDSYRRVRQLVAQTNTTFLDDHSILRAVSGDPQKPKLNVVILLEESLGAEFFGCLGRPLPTCTPYLDQLSTEGLLFTNIYASGNRTVRGMEGVLCSFPPLPGDSVVVRSGGRTIETLARVLKHDGYSNTFIYAGRGAFDHVRSFMLANGYDHFVEQSDFVNPQFSTIWGVCNEDLYARGIEECRKADQAGEPFLLTMLSVSNHEPFKFPEGRIPESPNVRKRENAVKYTDYAIGHFVEAAKKERFWTNTVFVVIADHGARVYGSQTIPLKSYEIPFLVLGPAAVPAPARIGTLGGQVDVSPTILGLIDRPYVSAFFGRDLFKIDPTSGRSLLNHNRDIGLFENDELVVLGLNKTAEYYEGNPKRSTLAPTTSSAANKTTEEDAIALFQVADDCYVHDRFQTYEQLAGSERTGVGAPKNDQTGKNAHN